MAGTLKWVSVASAVIVAGLLAYHGIGGWGWFLFAALLISA